MKASKANFRRAKNFSDNVGERVDVLTTQEIILSPNGQKMHTFNNDVLRNMRVSSISYWKDAGWTFDASRHGAERSGVNFDIVFEDDSRLTDETNEILLNWVKRLIWSLLVTPGANGRSKAISSMDSVGIGMKVAVKWLHKYNYKYPSQITEDVVFDFIDDLPDIVEADGAITISQVTLPLMFFEYLWRQSDELKSAGISPMPSNPFLMDSVYSISNKISEIGVGWIEPLPDEVTVLILNEAQKFLENYGETIVQLICDNYEEYFLEFSDEHKGIDRAKVRAVSAARAKFIKDFPHSIVCKNLFPSDLNYENKLERFGLLRGLMTDLTGACILLILGCTGMRASELVGVSSKPERETDVGPMRSTSSPSELFEMFYLTSILVKSIPSPTKFEWLVGMRLKGSLDIPPVVAAFNILDALFFYPRSIVSAKSLFVSFPPGRGLPRTEKGVGSIVSGHLREWMHSFLENRVDFSVLPDRSRRAVSVNDMLKYKKSKGRCIKPTQLRKSFALFTVQIDSKLLPAVAMHFKHYSYAVTESAYIGNSPDFLVERDSLALQKTTSLFYDIVSGNIDIAGRRGSMLEDELKNISSGLENEARWKFVKDLASSIGIYAWFQQDGICLPLDSSEMLCHRENGSLPAYGNIKPEAKNRRISLCSGCKNYLITSDNKDAWVDRYKENYLFCLQKEYLNEEATIFKKRVQVARTWLTKLDVDVGVLENQVNDLFESWKELILK